MVKVNCAKQVTMIAWEKEKRDRLDQILEKYSTKRSLTSYPDSKPNGPRVSNRNFGCGEFIEDFCRNSTIHGIKYMADRKRHWTERTWWWIAFLLCIFGCARLMLNVWQRWDRSPVIVTFAENPIPIHQIPFPAVTICIQTKAQSALFNYTEMHALIKGADSGFFSHNFTEEDIERIDAMSQVCDPNKENTTIGSHYANTQIVDILQQLHPLLSPTLFLCKWHNEQEACENIFSMILTEEGICYTFNNLEQSEIFREENLHSDYRYIESQEKSMDWSPENGYSVNASMNSYPRRVQAAGARSGMAIILPLNTDDLDFLCRGPSQGFKVQLHSPGEVPLLSQQFFRLSLDQEIILAVKPNMINTSEELRSYNINRRQCYFQNEKYLRFFKIYSQQNCELECLANFTLAKCGCVKFSMPRDKKTKICGARNVLCYYEAEDELFNPYEESTAEDQGCNCLPSCTAISYEAETSQGNFDWRKLLYAYGFPDGTFAGERLGRMVIFFRDSQFIPYKRSALFGFTDLLANCGGLLGLFMGMSILSLVEVLYFLTIRAWNGVKKYRETRAGRVRFIGKLP